MTDRRTTITRNWRPPGAPARRVDDFQEVAIEAQPAREEQPQEAVAPRSIIAARLQNWGAWNNARGSRGPDCMTGFVCESARRASLGDVWSGHQVSDKIDSDDAWVVQQAFTKLDEDHRKLLHWCYVEGAKEGVVAAVCEFPRREFDQRLAAAHASIECKINNMEKRG